MPQFPIIEFDGETFRILLTYLHTGSCPLSCISIPGLICSAEHYDLPELLQACFHHAKQFIRVNVVRKEEKSNKPLLQIERGITKVYLDAACIDVRKKVASYEKCSNGQLQIERNYL